MKIKGLDELAKDMHRIANRAKELDGTHNVPIEELLTPEFVSSHTKFANIEEMLEASGFKIESQDDFAAIPDKDKDKFIRSISAFSDWESMIGEAGSAWAVKKLGL